MANLSRTLNHPGSTKLREQFGVPLRSREDYRPGRRQRALPEDYEVAGPVHARHQKWVVNCCTIGTRVEALYPPNGNYYPATIVKVYGTASADGITRRVPENQTAQSSSWIEVEWNDGDHQHTHTYAGDIRPCFEDSAALLIQQRWRESQEAQGVLYLACGRRPTEEDLAAMLIQHWWRKPPGTLMSFMREEDEEEAAALLIQRRWQQRRTRPLAVNVEPDEGDDRDWWMVESEPWLQRVTSRSPRLAEGVAESVMAIMAH